MSHFSDNNWTIKKKTSYFFLFIGLLGIVLSFWQPTITVWKIYLEHSVNYKKAITTLEKFDQDGWDTWRYADDSVRKVPFKPVTYFTNMDKFHDEVDDFLGKPFFAKHEYYWQGQGNAQSAMGFDAGLIDKKRKWLPWQKRPVKDECKPSLDHLLELIFNVETYINKLKKDQSKK